MLLLGEVPFRKPRVCSCPPAPRFSAVTLFVLPVSPLKLAPWFSFTRTVGELNWPLPLIVITADWAAPVLCQLAERPLKAPSTTVEGMVNIPAEMLVTLEEP